ncbi:MAG: DNA-binding protein [Candidatus Nealsonbacteria bacterium RIFCSPHIGHO2_01_FULL_43_31]|uniref:DNA-binding protein n=2 Tax=Candidatus Nealsoniibacteriota TaxID=1817911 RepID=A0A1G2E702_9BACT|nr:MAG: Bacterial nucleoid DNA-binding protein [Parcubacteria group bacterium GW2011_GWB1_43_6]OGZ20318.1 MAG: DNA-binding protein [Candidatus Nealsonbacteria bacterium RIFCSPHIGHO2_01_FULL_43_31]OGZ21627.1 MAG: DNA-binding protein [Candidatus Nealsonbacteria bacterium RIFCSPHIGHO2_02_FULL_43_13]OGZ24350.1 MAG: DNA-binding protein [Candidatus Nealsonbacteria bacterium RIFCSPLOWO2_01_FULL_43_36]
MTKDNLIDALVKKTGASKTQAAECLTVLLDEITKSLSRGEEVVLTGFGKFKIAQRKEREGRNPKTGETIKIAAKKAPVFKAGSILKDAVK